MPNEFLKYLTLECTQLVNVTSIEGQIDDHQVLKYQLLDWSIISLYHEVVVYVIKG